MLGLNFTLYNSPTKGMDSPLEVVDIFFLLLHFITMAEKMRNNNSIEHTGIL